MAYSKFNLLSLIVFLGISMSCDKQNQSGEINVNKISEDSLSVLKSQVLTYLDRYDAQIAVAFAATNPRFYLGVNDRISMHAASTMKVPVMMEVYRQAEAGKFALDDSLLIVNQFTSIVDGSFFSLDISDDGGDRLYGMIGKKESIRSVVIDMIIYSGNLATNLLIDLVGANNVQQLMQQIGAEDIQVLRGVEDIKAYRAGKNNTTTAKDLAICYEQILSGEVWTEKSKEDMINILLDQQYRSKIPAGLPAHVKVAHKTGSITEIDHDSGIVFPPDQAPYILVVLTKGFTEHSDAQACIAGISKLVYNWYIKQ
jgi:beta-lactamase class A